MNNMLNIAKAAYNGYFTTKDISNKLTEAVNDNKLDVIKELDTFSPITKEHYHTAIINGYTDIVKYFVETKDQRVDDEAVELSISNDRLEVFKYFGKYVRLFKYYKQSFEHDEIFLFIFNINNYNDRDKKNEYIDFYNPIGLYMTHSLLEARIKIIEKNKLKLN